jgi:2-keto-4-pentenoate hydratase/2-oxohepta-3-ene-1,7-dioic acid hydratase in catechol pathway
LRAHALQAICGVTVCLKWTVRQFF